MMKRMLIVIASLGCGCGKTNDSRTGAATGTGSAKAGASAPGAAQVSGELAGECKKNIAEEDSAVVCKETTDRYRVYLADGTLVEHRAATVAIARTTSTPTAS
jgi:hypothetical protein